MKKRKDGYFQKKVSFKGKTKILYGKTQKEINEKYKVFLTEKEQSLKPEDTSALRWFDLWYESHCKVVKYNTAESYKKPVKDCKAYFSDSNITDLKPIDIQEFIDSLVDGGYARQTINLRYIVLCKTIDYAMFNSITNFNPARVVSLPRGLKVGERKTLTADEIKIVEESSNLFANTLLYTGCRRNEALALHWEDIDFEKRRIKINKQVMWEQGEKPYLDDTKSKKSNRVVPLLNDLYGLLSPVKKDKGLIFSNKTLISQKQFRIMWDKFRNEENVNITPHQFRHAYVTLLWQAGVDVKTAQELAGHSKIQTTMEIYTHLDSMAADKAGDKLNLFLKGSE